MSRPSASHLVLAVALLLGLTGCGADTTQPGPAVPTSSGVVSISSPFPPRPAALSLTAVDPCALLTPTQQADLGVRQIARDDDSDELHSPACQWANHGKPDNRWLVRLISKRGADYALGSTTGVQIVQVGGYGAVQTAPPYVDPERNCVLVVDVAPGQSLNVKYTNYAGDYPGINHEVACKLDRRAAELMLGNLRALAR